MSAGQNMEIERKFLVRVEKLSPQVLGVRGQNLIQGYLGSNPSVRVRVAYDVPSGRGEAWLTIKGPGKVSRKEFEYSIPHGEGMELLGLCKASLSKTRRRIRVGKHVWELDEFSGNLKGLWLAEIELTSEDEEFELPEWVGYEVSEDPQFTNSALAKSGKVPNGLGQPLH